MWMIATSVTIFRRDLATSRRGIVGLEASRLMWNNYKEIKKMDFWPKMARVLFLYLMFIEVFTNIDQIYNYRWLDQL